MKRNAILITVARGGIVNEKDLIRALNQNLLWGAELDCHHEEPPILSTWKELKETISTPHIGASTTDTQIQHGYDGVE